MSSGIRRYYFIRHATPVNDAGSFHLRVLDRDMRGLEDQELSARGRAQAEALAPLLRAEGIERMVSSTMVRARETAAILAGHSVPFDDHWDELREFNPGGLSGPTMNVLRRLVAAPLPAFTRKRVDAAWHRALTFYYILQWQRGATDGADTVDMMRAKIGASLARLDAMPQERIAIVGHGFWILCMSYFSVESSRFRRIRELGWVDNCSVTCIESSPSGQRRLGYFSRRLA